MQQHIFYFDSNAIILHTLHEILWFLLQATYVGTMPNYVHRNIKPFFGIRFDLKPARPKVICESTYFKIEMMTHKLVHNNN